MALVQCPECSAQVSSSALMCPTCGFPTSKLRGLCVAVMLKDREMVTDLIELGADVNGVDNNGRTPLMNAASIGSTQIVETLIDAGANPTFVNVAGESALTVAGNDEVTAILRRDLDFQSDSIDQRKDDEPCTGIETNVQEPSLPLNESEQSAPEPITVQVLSIEGPPPSTESELQADGIVTNDTLKIDSPALTLNEHEQVSEELLNSQFNSKGPSITLDESKQEIQEPETSVELTGINEIDHGQLDFQENDKRKEVDALTCLQCEGTIGSDDIYCSHCLTLIMRRYCSHCSKLIPDHSTICPLCSKNVTEHFVYASLHRKKILIAVSAALTILLLLLVLHWQHNSSEGTSAKTEDVSRPQISAVLPEVEAKQILEDSEPPVETSNKKQATKPNENDAIWTPFAQPTDGMKNNTLANSSSKAEEPSPQTSKVEEPSPSMTASTQRTLELNDQQRIKRGRFLNSKGYTLMKQGRPAEAIPLLEQSVRSFPQGTTDATYAYALFNLGVAWRMAGRPDVAIPILEERIKINNQRDVVERELLAAKRQARELGLGDNQ